MNVANLSIILPYAGSVILFQLVLSIRVTVERSRTGIRFGWGDNPALARIVRAHGNFAEYVPLTLLGLALAALIGRDPSQLHGACGLLVFGRIAHALGIYREFSVARLVGQIATWVAMLTTAALVLL